MKVLLIAVSLGFLASCTELAELNDFAAKQAQYNSQHGLASMNPSSMASPFNSNNAPDPFPHSESQDQQRALYEQNQQYQRDLQAGQERENGPDLSDMNCTTTSSTTGSANSMMSSSHTNCHN